MRRNDFQSLDPMEVAKRAGFDLEEAGRIGDPLRIVMAAFSCDEQKAKQWLFEQFGPKQGDEDIELIEGDVQAVKLAQNFSEDTALYTIGLHARRQQRVIEQPYVITSTRELFPCTAKELAEKSICYDKIPFPAVRWPLASVRRYRAGEHMATLRGCYDAILAQIDHHLDFGDRETPKLVALWIIGTYCYRLFGSFPYLHLNGNAECGKTKVLRLISLLSFNGEMMTSDSSRAAMLRTIDANACACCIDEVEGLQNPKDDDTRAVLAVLNTGYKLGGGDKKCEKVGKSEQWIPVFYDGYCPKVLAGIKQIAPVLQTRCIPIVMLRSRNKEILNRAIDEKDPRWVQIRSMLYPAMLDGWKDAQRIFGSMQSVVLMAREWELWKPIITLSSIIEPSGQLANDMRKLAERVQTQRKEADIGAPIFLSALIGLLYKDGEKERFYFTEELYNWLAESDEDEYGWLIDPYKKSFRGKWLGNEMRRCGVVKGKAELKSKHGMKSKGYTLRRDHIEGLLSAYDIKTVTDADGTATENEEATVTAE